MVTPGFVMGLVKIIRGKETAGAIAAGFATGMVFGLFPHSMPLSVFFFLIFIFTAMAKPAAILAAILFTPVGLLLEGLAHKLGNALWTAPGLKPLWTLRVDNTPIFPWLGLDDPVVLGKLVIGLGLSLPVFFAMKQAMVSYLKSPVKARVARIFSRKRRTTRPEQGKQVSP